MRLRRPVDDASSFSVPRDKKRLDEIRSHLEPLFNSSKKRVEHTQKELRFNTFRVEKSSRSEAVLTRVPLQMLAIQLTRVICSSLFVCGWIYNTNLIQYGLSLDGLIIVGSSPKATLLIAVPRIDESL